MRAPVRPVSGAWGGALERRFGRFFRPDPAAVLDPDASAEDFRRAMSSIHVGSTIKITERDRHPAADRMLLDHLDLTGATIVDLGASDGSTSLDLIAQLPEFSSYVVADLYATLEARRALRHVVLYDEAGEPILVSGRWWMAWPHESSAVRALCRPVLAAARRTPGQRVSLLNPDLRALMERDPRVSFRVHDVFEPWPAPAPDVVKVANLLRRVYFDEPQILAALAALRDSLEDGGHLLVVDDGTRWTSDADRGHGARAGLYRRAGSAFEVVARTEATPEIHDLVETVGR